MQKLISIFALVFSCSAAFAQDGYFVKAGAGVGSSNSSFGVMGSSHKANHQSVLSEQGQWNIGRRLGNWQLETGLGYLETGLSFVLGPGGSGGCVVGPNANPIVSSQTKSVKYTIQNPHLVVPLVLSYALSSGKKFTVNPGASVEALYNFKGKMAAAGLSDASSINMDYKYNHVAGAFLFKLEFQYQLCSHLGVWCSPSYQKMFTSLTTNVPGDYMSHIYDRALLISAGIKCNLHCCKKPGATTSGAKS